MSNHSGAHLRVLALSAPQFQAGGVGGRALSSEDAASLYNAMRVAAHRATRVESPWSASNWATDRRSRRETALLVHDLPSALAKVDALVQELRPNLVFLGAMTVCLPGAIACATRIKALLGDEVCIVLGGRHASETIYRDPLTRSIRHHASSPLRLMARGAIEPVFDVVLSGDGEFFVAAMGELVSSVVGAGAPASAARRRIDELEEAPGRWIAGTAEDGAARVVASRERPMTDVELVPPCQPFGVEARFDVFDRQPTAHLFSDIGRGCIYDCAFCSERVSVVGPPRDFRTSDLRLLRQMAAAAQVIEEDHPGEEPCGFVEDSTLLGMHPELIHRFCEGKAARLASFRFGGQATVDQVLARPKELSLLRSAGLSYLFVGIETPDPTAIGGMSKDTGRKRKPWLHRTRDMLDILSSSDIKVGFSLLFGMGESHAQRRAFLRQIERMRADYPALVTISMNWAVQHPLMGRDGGASYDYLDWAIDDALLPSLCHFGEASTRYPLQGCPAPDPREAMEIIAWVDAILRRGGERSTRNHEITERQHHL
ncbi:B12-binding domain/radical SAM domain-containing protein [Sorangium sp. So ce321]|uniref:B12-binding domain/radical SAM domain-containing protein n=1 Tax=Sorangium sp. So ce321 TaxID=3133300 RepID=UPI003F5EE057